MGDGSFPVLWSCGPPGAGETTAVDTGHGSVAEPARAVRMATLGP